MRYQIAMMHIIYFLRLEIVIELKNKYRFSGSQKLSMTNHNVMPRIIINNCVYNTRTAHKMKKHIEAFIASSSNISLVQKHDSIHFQGLKSFILAARKIT